MPDSEQSSPGLPTSRAGVGLVSANSSGNGDQGAMASTSNSQSTTSSAAVVKAMVKYGELVILGYNGQLPQGKKNSVKMSTQVMLEWFDEIFW